MSNIRDFHFQGNVLYDRNPWTVHGRPAISDGWLAIWRNRISYLFYRAIDRADGVPFSEWNPAYGSTEPQMPPVMATVDAPMTSTRTG
jgi:hypothetical protein